METLSAARDRERVAALLETLSERVPESAVARIPQLLEVLPDPVGALQRLEQYYRRRSQQESSRDFEGNAIYAALTVFGNSRYLSNMLLNSPDLLQWALDPTNLERTIPVGELRSDLGSFSVDASDEQAAMLLARFKGRHMLRIALRDLLSVAPLADTALELSTLADTVIQGAHDHIRQQLVKRLGRPLCPTESGVMLCNFAVVALGKLGGSELNYSSDIDLMYLHTGSGHTSGPIVISNKDFTGQLAMRLTSLLSMVTPEGFSYRVDLRLRPEGSAGELVVPLSGAAQYYLNRARDWELQMLIKARPVAGDLHLGRRFLEIVSPQIYQTSTDFSQIERLAETRDRMQEQRRRHGRTSLDVKLDPGGIRDIEFLVQCLQRLYGGQDRFLRSGGTMYALHRLREKGHLGTRDYGALFSAYRYLRKVEHYLQLVDNKQTHELPTDAMSLQRLALQMGIRSGSSHQGALEAAIKKRYEAVTEIYERVIRSQRPPIPRANARGAAARVTPAAPKSARDEPVASAVWRVHLPRLRRASPELAASFEKLSLRWGNRALEHFLERVVGMPKALEILVRRIDLVPYIAELMEYSPYFAGYLLRFPEDAAVIAPGNGGSREDGAAEPRAGGCPMPTDVRSILDANLDPDDAAAELRKFFRRAMLAIQTRSICQGEDVFRTLLGASDLAEWILRAAHALALREVLDIPAGQAEMSDAVRIIALGRLGMREFDLGSDADVVFVIPDEQAARRAAWTQVVNRIIDIVSSYTAEGQMFSIDTRLRPLGRDGELVQTEKQFLTYLGGRAESWEALTYMKARTVAGDVHAGEGFLARLQEVLWQHFAHREELGSLLARMRARLEAEQGEAKPLKSGRGGYYDVDFILMYWRLLHAESFYASLNTPQRIEIIRRTSPEHDADLDVLLRTTTILRSLDHGTRLSKGTSSHALPPTEWQRELLAELVARWLPAQDRTTPLVDLVESARRAARAVFNEAFRA